MSKMAQTIAVLGVVAGLGVAALPLSTYAQDATIDVMASVDGTLGMSVSSNEVQLGTLLAGGAANTGNVVVTVNTTDANGYKLYIKDSDAQTALVAVDAAGNVIAGGETAMIEAGTPAVGSSAWGYQINGGAYAAITTSEVKIAETAASGIGSTTITFGASADADQAAGSYKGGVVVTALAAAETQPGA